MLDAQMGLDLEHTHRETESKDSLYFDGVGALLRYVLELATF